MTTQCHDKYRRLQHDFDAAQAVIVLYIPTIGISLTFDSNLLPAKLLVNSQHPFQRCDRIHNG